MESSMELGWCENIFKNVLVPPTPILLIICSPVIYFSLKTILDRSPNILR